jgi:hypothetical protein
MIRVTKAEENKYGGTCNARENKRTACKMSVGKPE